MATSPIEIQQMQKALAERLAPLKVRVARKAAELHVLLEYSDVYSPPQSQLVQRVVSGLLADKRLLPAAFAIERLILYGRKAGQNQAEWRQVLQLSALRTSPKPVETSPEVSSQLPPTPSKQLPVLKYQPPQVAKPVSQQGGQRRMQLVVGGVLLLGSLLAVGVIHQLGRDEQLAEQSYQQGLQLARAERWQQAIEQYELGLRRRPRDPRLQAALLHAQNRLNQANQRIQQAHAQLAGDPGNTAARLELARAFYQQGNFSAAAGELSTLLAFDSENAPARFLLAELHAAQGNWPEAIEQYRAALAVDPLLPSAQRQLGIALLSQGQTESALQALQTAVDQNPNDAEAHYQLGSAYAQQDDWDAALRHYLQAAHLDPAHVAAQQRLAQWFSARGYTEAALRSLQAAVQADPDNPQLHLQLGMARQVAGELRAARDSYERALSLDSTLTEARLQLAQLYLAQNSPADAIPLFEEILAADPDHWQAHSGLGIALAEQGGSLDKAIAHLQQASRQQPTHALTRRYLGLALERAGRREEAIAQFQEAVRLDPNDAEARRHLGLLLAQQGQTQAALAQLESSLDQDPTNPTAIGSRATLQVSVGGQAEREKQVAEVAATLDRQATPNPSRLSAATEHQATQQLKLQIPLSRLQPGQANLAPSSSSVTFFQAWHSSFLRPTWMGGPWGADQLPGHHPAESRIFYNVVALVHSASRCPANPPVGTVTLRIFGHATDRLLWVWLGSEQNKSYRVCLFLAQRSL